MHFLILVIYFLTTFRYFLIQLLHIFLQATLQGFFWSGYYTYSFRQHFRGFSFNQSRQTIMTCGDAKAKSPGWPCVSARACHTRAVIYVNYSCPDSRGAVLCAATDWTVVRSSCQLAQPTGESYGETILPSETLALGNSAWWAPAVGWHVRTSSPCLCRGLS